MASITEKARDVQEKVKLIFNKFDSLRSEFGVFTLPISLNEDTELCEVNGTARMTYEWLESVYSVLKAFSELSTKFTQTEPYSLKESRINYPKLKSWDDPEVSDREAYVSIVNPDEYTKTDGTSQEDIPPYCFGDTGLTERRIDNYFESAVNISFFDTFVDGYYDNAVNDYIPGGVYDVCDIKDAVKALNIKQFEFFDPAVIPIENGKELIKWLESYVAVADWFLNIQNVRHDPWNGELNNFQVEPVSWVVPNTVRVDYERLLFIDDIDPNITEYLDVWDILADGNWKFTLPNDDDGNSKTIELPNGNTVTVTLGDSPSGVYTSFAAAVDKYKNDNFIVNSEIKNNGFFELEAPEYFEDDVITQFYQPVDSGLIHEPVAAGDISIVDSQGVEIENISYTSWEYFYDGFQAYLIFECNYTFAVGTISSDTCIYAESDTDAQILSKSIDNKVPVDINLSLLPDPNDPDKQILEGLKDYSTEYKGDSIYLYQGYQHVLRIKESIEGVETESVATTPTTYSRDKTQPKVYVKTSGGSIPEVSVGYPQVSTASFKEILEYRHKADQIPLVNIVTL
jgi:hypothetical protein